MHQPTVGARLNNGRIWTEHEAGAKTADLARKHGVSEATNRGRMKVRWQVRYDSGSAALTHSTKRRLIALLICSCTTVDRSRDICDLLKRGGHPCACSKCVSSHSLTSRTAVHRSRCGRRRVQITARGRLQLSGADHCRARKGYAPALKQKQTPSAYRHRQSGSFGSGAKPLKGADRLKNCRRRDRKSPWYRERTPWRRRRISSPDWNRKRGEGSTHRNQYRVEFASALLLR